MTLFLGRLAHNQATDLADHEARVPAVFVPHFGG
jgi:hypothetical protein